MNRYTLEQRVAVEISSSKSGNEKLKSILSDVDAYSAALLQQTPCSTQLPPISESFKDWCRETKRNGGVLIGSSIREFFEWDEAKYGRQVRRQLS